METSLPWCDETYRDTMERGSDIHMPALTSARLGHKGNTSDYERILSEIARYVARGCHQHFIAEKLCISQARVSHYVTELKRRWAEINTLTIQEMVEEKLVMLREVRTEAWAAWDRSKEDAESSSEETLSMQGSEDRLRSIITTTGRLPNNQYLKTVLDTIQAERELLGLDEAKKVDVLVTGNIDYDKLYGATGVQPGPRIIVDPVQERIKQEMLQLPSPPSMKEEVSNEPSKPPITEGS